jgi:hypothetical protein
MEVITNGHKNTMGETGAGITSEDQINVDTPNNFTNKWGTYLISKSTHGRYLSYIYGAVHLCAACFVQPFSHPQ